MKLTCGEMAQRSVFFNSFSPCKLEHPTWCKPWNWAEGSALFPRWSPEAAASGWLWLWTQCRGACPPRTLPVSVPDKHNSWSLHQNKHKSKRLSPRSAKFLHCEISYVALRPVHLRGGFELVQDRTSHSNYIPLSNTRPADFLIFFPGLNTGTQW